MAPLNDLALSIDDGYPYGRGATYCWRAKYDAEEHICATNFAFLAVLLIIDFLL
jgi:hypothetical protein